MEYPAQAKRRKVLEYLYRKLNETRAMGGQVIFLKKKWLNNDLILQSGTGKEVANQRLGLNGGEVLSIITELRNEGYLRVRRRSSSTTPWLVIKHLTDAGLREIGELPDPHSELMQRLDLAIVQIQQDSRLSEPQKRQAINWLQEGTVIARTLTIDAIKAILIGAIL